MLFKELQWSLSLSVSIFQIYPTHKFNRGIHLSYQNLSTIAGVIAQGAYEAGGAEKAVIINRDHGRLNFFTFTGDLTTRIDTLSAWLGQLFISLSVLGCQQNNVQRYMSLKSQKDVNR